MIDSTTMISDAQLLAAFDSSKIGRDGVPHTPFAMALRYVAELAIAAYTEGARQEGVEAIRELTASLRGGAGEGTAADGPLGPSAWCRVYWSFIDQSSDAGIEEVIERLCTDVRRTLILQIGDQRPGRMVLTSLTGASS